MFKPKVRVPWLAAWAVAGLGAAWLWSDRARLPWGDTLLVALPAALSAALLLPSAWAITRVVPLGEGRRLGWGLARHAATACLVGGLWAGVWGGLAAVLGLWGEPHAGRPASVGAGLEQALRLVWLLALPFAALYGLALMLGEVLQAQARAERDRQGAQQAQHHALQAQLQMLRAQVEPHFLFNCLHSISSLTVLDPPAAQRMTLQLADYFRQTLAYSQRPWVSLQEEWMHGQAFLSLEAIRMGEERLRWRFEASPQALRSQLPALVLQPLLENAVKHGLWPRPEGGCVQVQATVLGEWLRLTVSNPLPAPLETEPGAAQPPGTGTGLRNLRERLAATLGGQALVETVLQTLPSPRSEPPAQPHAEPLSSAPSREPGEQHFTVALTLPLRAFAAPAEEHA
jgi:two-component system sensor histidine kinase AlgZ